jgi:hypothetical protein
VRVLAKLEAHTVSSISSVKHDDLMSLKSYPALGPAETAKW